MSYEQKYLKYKIKYLILRMKDNPNTFEQNGGSNINDNRKNSKINKYVNSNDIQKLVLKLKKRIDNKIIINDKLDKIYESTQKKLNKQLKNKK